MPSPLSGVARAYRGRGADPPFGDPRRAHGVAMEGYFWRLTDAETERAIIALCGVCRDATGSWATVAVAAHPERLLIPRVLEHSRADPDRLGLRSGGAFEASAERLTVDLGAEARLDVRFAGPIGWPRRAYGALGPAHWLPGLGQYWHPHVLGGRVDGTLRHGTETIVIDSWRVYAEKNWGTAFPGRWWWGEAHDFPGANVCVAFAGGELGYGVRATAIVVRIGGELVRLAAPTAVVRAAAGGGGWSLRARGGRYAVELEGAAVQQPFALPVPVPGERRFTCHAMQHLAGRLRVNVRRRGRLVFAGESLVAGLEYGG